MDELILSQATLLDVCRTEKVKSASSYICGMLMPTLLWAWNAKNVLEIGVYRGYTSLVLGMQLEMMGGERNLWLSDIDRDRVNHSLELLHTYAPNVNVIGIYGDSRGVDWSAKAAFDFAYIDGNHSYRSAKADLGKVLPAMAERSAVLVHDYTQPHHMGVVQAVNETVANDPSWNMIPIPAQTGKPVALIARAVPGGLDYLRKSGEMEV